MFIFSKVVSQFSYFNDTNFFYFFLELATNEEWKLKNMESSPIHQKNSGNKGIICEDQATQTDDEDISLPHADMHGMQLSNAKGAVVAVFCILYNLLIGCNRQCKSSVNITNGQASEESLHMLPIFQRLLEDKNCKKSAHESCPNILLKCDIVEYL